MRASWILLAAFSIGCGSSEGSTGDNGPGGPDGGGGFDIDAGTSCPAGTTTVLTVKVVSPAKSNPDPIYNAVAFIPVGEVERFGKGVRCERCGTIGSKFKVAALTGADGTFRLEGVPAGKDVPFVVQIGRWRRQVKIPEVKACETNALPTELTRLPRNHDEGDIPLTALVTGSADPMECVLRKIGVDDTEFAALDSLGQPDKPGARIHMFKSFSGADIGSGTVGGASLYKNALWMKDFDQILLPCENSARTTDKPAGSLQNVVDYANAGGRVLTTHYGFVWMRDSPDAAWKSMASWTPTSMDIEPLPAQIDESFPKGKAMAEWLQITGATKERGKLDIHDGRVDLASKPGAAAQVWITSTTPPSTQHFTFNTPIGKPAADQCGKVIYSNFHVVGSDDFSTVFFPKECTDGPLTAQERVIEFMLFDLASCVQPDGEPPKPPR